MTIYSPFLAYIFLSMCTLNFLKAFYSHGFARDCSGIPHFTPYLLTPSWIQASYVNIFH